MVSSLVVGWFERHASLVLSMTPSGSTSGEVSTVYMYMRHECCVKKRGGWCTTLLRHYFLLGWERQMSQFGASWQVVVVIPPLLAILTLATCSYIGV